MKRSAAKTWTIREILDGAKFSIDSYRREYAWNERNTKHHRLMP